MPVKLTGLIFLLLGSAFQGFGSAHAADKNDWKLVWQDEFDGSLRTLKQHLSDTGELLRLALAEPRFAPEDIERIRGEILAGLARQAKNPRSLSGRLWMHDAFEKHPYGSSVDGSEESVASCV